MTIWFKKFDIAEINERASNSLSDHLGIRFTELGHNYLKATMPIDERTLQPMGIMHGGASAALAETVASAAANYCIDMEKARCVGVNIFTNHIKAVKKGPVEAIAKPLHVGKSTQLWEIEIYNPENQLISVSRLTLANIKLDAGLKLKNLSDDKQNGITQST